MSQNGLRNKRIVPNRMSDTNKIIITTMFSPKERFPQEEPSAYPHKVWLMNRVINPLALSSLLLLSFISLKPTHTDKWMEFINEINASSLAKENVSYRSLAFSSSTCG